MTLTSVVYDGSALKCGDVRYAEYVTTTLLMLLRQHLYYGYSVQQVCV